MTKTTYVFQDGKLVEKVSPARDEINIIPYNSYSQLVFEDFLKWQTKTIMSAVMMEPMRFSYHNPPQRPDWMKAIDKMAAEILAKHSVWPERNPEPRTRSGMAILGHMGEVLAVEDQWFHVGDVVTRDGTDEHLVTRTNEQPLSPYPPDLIDVECIKEPTSCEGEEPWTKLGETEVNLARRYSLVRRGDGKAIEL